MIRRFSLLMSLVLTAIFIISCSPRATYERKLKYELASGLRNDSIFMGIYLGMPEKEFYIKCWNLNKKGLIKQSETNTKVEYLIKKELRYPAKMDFYPLFREGKISEMPVKFVYEGWAPWNNKLSADKLEADILNWYENTYGKGFMKVEHPQRGIAYVKIDGNRRITIFKQNDTYVWAVFTDMLVSKSWNVPVNDSTNLTSEN